MNRNFCDSRAKLFLAQKPYDTMIAINPPILDAKEQGEERNG